MKCKINAVYKKELKTSVRTVHMALTILGYNAVLALIGLLSFYFVFNYSYSGNVDYSGILQIYLFLAMIEFGLVLFVVPAFTSSAISGEREKQTLEILLTTKLSPRQIIHGKLMSSISSTLLLIFSSLPTLALVFSVGGVRLVNLIQLMLFCVVTAIFVGSIGIFFSTLFKRTVPSTVFTYGSILLLILGTILLVYVIYKAGLHAYDKEFYRANLDIAYAPPGVGNLLLILLCNPAVSLISLLATQVGSVGDLGNLLGNYGKTNSFILMHWYEISIIIQMLIALLLLKISSIKLNPIGNKKK
ncbi:MAG: ABC transporter permease subunit [Acetivibrio sp.]